MAITATRNVSAIRTPMATYSISMIKPPEFERNSEAEV
jgi:hypothetical protein